MIPSTRSACDKESSRARESTSLVKGITSHRSCRTRRGTLRYACANEGISLRSNQSRELSNIGPREHTFLVKQCMFSASANGELFRVLVRTVSHFAAHVAVKLIDKQLFVGTFSIKLTSCYLLNIHELFSQFNSIFSKTFRGSYSF